MWKQLIALNRYECNHWAYHSHIQFVGKILIFHNDFQFSVCSQAFPYSASVSLAPSAYSFIVAATDLLQCSLTGSPMLIIPFLESLLRMNQVRNKYCNQCYHNLMCVPYFPCDMCTRTIRCLRGNFFIIKLICAVYRRTRHSSSLECHKLSIFFKEKHPEILYIFN